MMDTFFVKINPIWENWINTYNFYFAGKSDNYFPFSEVDHVFHDFLNFAVR